MDSSKIKNIIIFIMLALNLFLFGIVMLDSADAARAKNAAEDAAVKILSANGIALAQGVDIDQEAPAVYSINRSMETEAKRMKALIGAGSSEDLGGNIRFYVSDSGQASVRGTGELDVLFSPGAYSLGSDPAHSAAKVMKKLGLKGDADGASVQQSGDSTIVSLSCLWKGCPVYNAQLTFTYGGGELVMLSGTRLFDESTPSAETQALTSLSALIRFIEVVREQGYVCSELRKLQCGYILSVTVSGESTLTPIWHFETDTGNIYINAVTGRSESGI